MAKIGLVVLFAVLMQGVALLYWGWEAFWVGRAEAARLYFDTLEELGSLDACDADPARWRAPAGIRAYPIDPNGHLYDQGGPFTEPVSLPQTEVRGLVARGLPKHVRGAIYVTSRSGACHRFAVLPAYEDLWKFPKFTRLLVSRLAVDAILIAILSLAIGLPLTRRIKRMARAARDTVKADFAGLLPEGSDELGDLGQAFNQATAAARDRLSTLQRRDQVLTETLADLAHDVRTPLATLKLGLGHQSGSEAHRNALRAEVEHLDAMFQNLASMLQFEATGLDIRATTLNAGDVIEQVALRFGVIAGDKDMVVESSLPEGPLPVRADPVALAQALGNLVHNGIKFGEQAVTVAGFRRGDEIWLQVFDDGPGFDVEELPRLAERRYRGSRGALTGDRGRRGQGLGLAIALEVAERHGGRLSLDRVDDEGGTVASVILPAADAP